ncbi:hypothetical protein POSPLADRAFT_1048291 [Postia placenta MAD-698-R-SB12]|uniref:AAA+ ATPase domain-containing protein n=1 Tax=Postia placenta MAD-698-R-SB12 TaxID=670580 RepID=A0A1X6MUC8_9APHY|nr:hypothetical protein POSPLADRAFT_1048291 [Postia placenta MAD-698-R-SB12]OSX59822.1 hypothetical protein POSPLADRAFT_1048291 [Postia placenta MAD-698-R-SB12]
MAFSTSQEKKVQAELKQLRDTPVATPSETTLSLLTDYLLGPPQKQAEDTPKQHFEHWFCSRANDIVVETAKFLVRLHAYNSVRVKTWRKEFTTCMSRCCECVRAFQESKSLTRQTYFGAFSDDILKGFYTSFDNWELEMVLSSLSAANLSPESMSDAGHTLSKAPPPVVYHIFYNLHILHDSRIIRIIQSCPPKQPITAWPSDYPPPGLFFALSHKQEDVRGWARGQLNLHTTMPMLQKTFSPVYCNVLKAVTNLISTPTDANTSKANTFPLTQDVSTLWSSYASTLRFVPEDFLHKAGSANVDIRHLVISHLHDTANHFAEVLKSFLLILNRIGSTVWEGEGPEYPQVVFNSIKDNPRYLDALQGLSAVRRDNWMLSWMETYVKSIGGTPAFRDTLPVVMHFLCEELQHERFAELRPAAISMAARLLLAVFHQAEKEVSTYQHSLVWEAMAVHASMFISIAFGRAYTDEKWTEARAHMRKLIRHSLANDIRDMLTTISILSGSIPWPEQPLSLTIREEIWRRIYSSIQPGDSGAISLVVTILAAVAHVDELKEAAFVDRIASSKQDVAYKNLLGSVNRALGTVRDGFGDAVTRYLDLSAPSVVAELFRRPDVAKSVMILMLSPVETLQETAQALAGTAFDVEVRMDCFRALIERFPEPALAGVFSFLDTYTHFAQMIPEACSLSKALARCLTDIIDVLCSSPDGFLLNQPFLKDGPGAAIPAQLPRWWYLMTKALSVIFLKTPKWALYFDNAEMVLWMRDALMFGRDMLAQRRVIESAALADSRQSQDGTERKLSRVGKKMVDDLQPVLFEATRWLRLTDEELLHQSFSLLESLLSCFKDNQVRPRPESLQKLQKHIDDARKGDPSRPQTRLDAPRLSRLQDAVSAFDEDDEIQIISHRLPEKAKDKSSKRKANDTKIRPLAGPSSTRKVSVVDQLKASAKTKPSTKAHIAKYLTAEEEMKLEADVPQPRFSRAAKPAPAALLRGDRPEAVKKEESASLKSASSAAASSSESDSSDEEEEKAGLASLSKMQRTPVIKKPAGRRQVMRLDVPTTIRNPAIERMNKREDARRTQLRLKPDISGLHRMLLTWDYDYSGPSPPGDSIRLMAVPDRFKDVQHFRSVFEPMLLLECWAQLVESKEVALETYDCRIASRQFVDDWIELDISISESVKKDWNLSDADVVVLRHPSSRKCILGKTQSYRATPFGIQALIRCVARNDPGLQANSIWRLSKVVSLTTLHREYAALMALPYYDMLDSILQARLTRPGDIAMPEVQRTMSTYNVNEPQARAVLYSLKADGFALVQGPPGTGKTSTICGLVHAFLSNRPKPVTTIHAGRTTGPADRAPVKKVLLCAPSNAAIDEIAHRLKEGISGAGRRMVSPKVVRIGNVNSMNVSVRDISLEQLIEQKLNADPALGSSTKDSGSEIVRLRAEIESVKKLRQQKIEEITNVHDNTARTIALEEDIKRLNKQRVMLTHQFDKLKDQQKSDSRTMDATRRKFRTEVLMEADVICSTLSGAAYEYLEQFDFELIIIDEAAQAIELSSLIPLKYRCGRCVLVGDPQQLPPTVKSQEACNFGYNQSLFVRLQRQCPDAVHLLSIQYRMHPDISQVPSRLFYGGRLEDGPGMVDKTARPWHSQEKLGTYRFFNVNNGVEEIGGGNSHSYVNRAECQIAVALYNRLRREFTTFDFDFKVGVISMYRGQIFEMRRAFEKMFGQTISGTVDFNTVDGFQGQEKDVIILSCVRAGPGVQSVGFLKDIRRMNVALTRAKSSLFVLGHAPTLERSDDTWRTIVSDARTRSCLFDVDVSYFTTPASRATVAAPAKQSKPQSKQMKPNSSKQASSSAPQVPQGLATPRELKVKVEQSNASSPGDARVGQKRPAPVEESSEPMPSRGPDPQNDQVKPKPPPKKRPKGGPSLFIPKNKVCACARVQDFSNSIH